MSLEEWLKKNCPDDGPKYYSFNYEKYKRDTVNEQKKHKEFFVTKMEKIVETTILDEFQKVLINDPYTNEYNRNATGWHSEEDACKLISEMSIGDSVSQFWDNRRVPTNKKYVVDDRFLEKLILKIKERM